MLKCAIGHSEDPDSISAIAEVLEQLQEALGEVMPQAGVLFAAIDFDHALILQEIMQAFPGIELIGGTTDGEISSLLEFQQDSLTLMVFCSDTITISAGIGQDVSRDLAIAAKNSVEQAIAAHDEPVKLCISIPESLTVGGDSIVDALKEALGDNTVPIFGGLTADQWRMKQTYQFFKSEVHSDAVPVLLFSGPVKFSHGIASGWQPIGKPGVVTKAIDNIVYEIDRQPAQDFYARYLGSLLPSSEYPLALFESGGDRYFMRAPIGLEDPEIGSIHFFGCVPTNSVVQITEATHDGIIAASQKSFDQAIADYAGTTPEAALFFSCASRRQILGSRTAEEYGQIQRSLEKILPSCGFYTNGEIAPLHNQGISCFHNQTFITLILGEV